MIRSVRNATTVAAMFAVTGTGLAGCATYQGMNNTEKGAVIGAAAGGTLGGVVANRKDKSTARGAIIGATIGGAAGALIGRDMDKQAAKLAQQLPDAQVERVGEGIQVTFPSGILFAFDSDNLQGNARQDLSDLARSLQEYPNTNVLVVGHTDAQGSDSYNYALSQRRAASAANYLSSQGISRGRLMTEGRGEGEPVASNGTDYGRQQNRRVEVAIYADEAYRAQVRQRVNGR